MIHEASSRTVNLDLLRTFAAFAERRSFTAAAKALHLSQPAVHVHVKRLGESLDAVLYERRGRELVLTEAGERTLAYAREALERADAFVRELHGEPAAGPVRLCAGEGAFLYLLGDALQQARARGIALRIEVADASDTVRAVQRGDAHLGVAPLASVPAGLEAADVADVGCVIAVPARHALARKRTIAAQDLAGEPLILPPSGRPLRDAIDVVLRAAAVEWSTSIEVRGWPLALRFAELGLGLAIVNDFCPIPRGLVARPIRGLPRQRYRVVRRSGVRHAPEVGALYEAIAKARLRRR
jgi:DNA-binding transcriptional LysR family regulator